MFYKLKNKTTNKWTGKCFDSPEAVHQKIVTLVQNLVGCLVVGVCHTMWVVEVSVGHVTWDGRGDTFHGGSLGWHTGTGLLLVVLRHRHSISHREGIP